MYRTHTCGELRPEHIGKNVTLAGWVRHNRDFGGMTFIDLRDRYGITQLVFGIDINRELCERAREFGREYVIQANGKVRERENKNPNIPTGEVEVVVSELKLLNASEVPPFTIETETDGGEELRMQYRYLDLRRPPLQQNILLRHKMLHATRNYMSSQGFVEVETPCLIKSTPEGARDFVVPSRMHEGEFYALPQSPQTFKQLLMVAGFDRYFQIVKCFRDEDLRADRQPEFTQLDCEMSFVEEEDVIQAFSGFLRHLIKEVKDVDIGKIPRMPYAEAMRLYGSDKPDLRFGMPIHYLTETDSVKQTEFAPFRQVVDAGGVIGALSATGCSEYSRKQLDAMTEFVKVPHRGLKGLIWVKYNTDSSIKSSVDKFFDEDALRNWLQTAGAKPGDLLLVGAGPAKQVQKSLGDLRLHLAEEMGLRDPEKFAPLWVTDFPMFEWNEEHQGWSYMHHPFTSPHKADMDKLDTATGEVRAHAYDIVLNGSEVGGGSIRIHDHTLQHRIFEVLGLDEKEIQEKFGFLLEAFTYGAPPHGGIAFGFDRLSAILAGRDSIREVMAFPKNNAGRDLMIDAPAPIDSRQLDELNLSISSKPTKEKV